jgi:predicted regulator of Ras-like GTPase activity (Roadblock/LC7/MglB family)
MPFKKLLTELVRNVPGATGAILADWEGEAVDQVARMDDYELKVIGAHQGVILYNLKETLSRLEESEVRELVVTTGTTQTLVLPINAEYFLVLTMEKENAEGRALLEARRCVSRLKKEIE